MENKKLTDEQKKYIKKEYSTGEYSYSKLAKKYSVTKGTIYYIMHPEKYQEQLEGYKSLKKVSKNGK